MDYQHIQKIERELNKLKNREHISPRIAALIEQLEKQQARLLRKEKETAG